VKTRKGFSYIEIIIALAIFAVLVLAALPLLNQAGRNLVYAEESYKAHLAAQGIMLAVRDALGASGLSGAQAVAGEYALRHGVEGYSVWVFYENPYTAAFYFGSFYETLGVNATLPQLSHEHFLAGAYIIVVVVWDEGLSIAGRAIGFVKNYKT
jgi:prepilin-type N-terminal cleavage/methylation domain-containing protein